MCEHVTLHCSTLCLVDLIDIDALGWSWANFKYGGLMHSMGIADKAGISRWS